jgi:hypothetical protein
LETDFKRRQEHKIPPGYKDSAKDDLGVGDVLIWHAILELGKRDKKDVLFVSADGKSDWYHQSDGPLYPRFELVDEFRRVSDGASFHILKFSDFLDLFGAKETVVKEIRQEEAKLSLPTESQPPTRGLRLVALAAVGRWLAVQFPEQVIQADSDEELDFSIVTADGRKIGVVVKTLHNPLLWLPQVLRMVERSKSRITSDCSEVLICLVANSEATAMSAGNRLSRRESPSGTTEICVGWLDAHGNYNVGVRFRME